MDNYTTTVDKFFREIGHLDRVLGADTPGAGDIDLALAQAKRCRRECNNLVRVLARLRDNATGQEATST